MSFIKLFKNVKFKKYIILALTLGTFVTFAEMDPSKTFRKGVEITDESDVEAIDAVLVRMKERLLLMHEVSKWKWKNTQPIEKHHHDYKQMNAFSHLCQELNIDKNAALQVMNSQIEAGKVIQTEDFQNWVIEQKHVGHAKAPNEEQLIQQLGVIDEELAQKLALLLPRMKKGDLRTAIEMRAQAIFKDERISSDAKKTALTPLLTLYNKVSNH